MIGHAESLSSPYHHERVRALAHRTHGDFRHGTMQPLPALARAAVRAERDSRARRGSGRSVRGRTISAVRSGDPGAPRKVLVVGCDPRQRDGRHRDRAAPRAPAAAGRHGAVAGRATSIPDGARGHTRQNARGVDLNRNFPCRWRQIGRRGDLDVFGQPRRCPSPRRASRAALIGSCAPRSRSGSTSRSALVDRSGGDATTSASRSGSPRSAVCRCDE